MTAGFRYLAGMALVGLGFATLARAVPSDLRDEVGWAVVIALAVQAPLGWWTLRSIGRPGFQLVWSLGMLVRFAAVGLTGLVLVPALGWDLGPTLGTLVAAMMALVLVEAVTAVREHS
ncbi:MAG TPA: hypothetical protein VFB61_15125 [Gemmatimonadales bacterium]|nr:hypothetical protein [Gemmatimonadales bacterium]